MKIWGLMLALFLALSVAGRAEATVIIIQQQIFTQDLQFVSSSPGVNQGVGGPPKNVSVSLSAAANPQVSSIEVYGPYGNKLDVGPLEVNGMDMSVAMPDLGNGYAGVYRVVWKAACQCNNPNLVSGTFYFHIN